MRGVRHAGGDGLRRDAVGQRLADRHPAWQRTLRRALNALELLDGTPRDDTVPAAVGPELADGAPRFLIGDRIAKGSGGSVHRCIDRLRSDGSLLPVDAGVDHIDEARGSLVVKLLPHTPRSADPWHPEARLAPNLGTFASIKIDGTAPVLNNLPANVSVATDAGSTYGAYVANPGVTVSDNCDTLTPTLLVTYPDSSTASTWPANGMFPIGTTTLAWSVTDESGNFASASRTIVVANYQLVDATMSFDGPFVTASTRSIRFKAGSSTQVLSLSASGSPFAAGSINAIQVPVAASYTCLRAKDPTHSVPDTASATVSGVRYQAAFSLKQGDSNDDDLVDILDFGIFVAAYGAGKALDATSNFNSDTIIANADFAFISINFFNVGEACGAYTGATPRDRMTVKELRRSGRGGLAIADINGDGWVDTTDITLFMQGVAPRKPAEPARAAAPDAANW